MPADIRPDEEELAIIKALENLKDPNEKRVKAVVAQVGLDFKWEVWPTPDRIRKGWLFDLVWQRNPNGELFDLPLVLEAEWQLKASDIHYDFQKLLVSRSPHRIMVFRGKNTEIVETQFDTLVSLVNRFRLTVKGDRFLLCGWRMDKSEFAFRLHLAPNDND